MFAQSQMCVGLYLRSTNYSFLISFSFVLLVNLAANVCALVACTDERVVDELRIMFFFFISSRRAIRKSTRFAHKRLQSVV